MNAQRQWTVRINGVDQISVKTGERVEIGRKPLRPLADDGNKRLDVVDGTKSMSKRHALFEVKPTGEATVRDLNSTNGSYVVRDNGDLLRLLADTEFILPSSVVRMQFGDVPVEFIGSDVVETVSTPQVPDLFGYAVGAAPQEPDAADMSVDEILDLRAGEPTSMFDAGSVKQRVSDLKLGMVEPDPVSPRDLFADAKAVQTGEVALADITSEPEPSQEDAVPVEPAVKQSAVKQSAVKQPVTARPDVVPIDAIAKPAAWSEDDAAKSHPSQETTHAAETVIAEGEQQPADTVVEKAAETQQSDDADNKMTENHADIEAAQEPDLRSENDVQSQTLQQTDQTGQKSGASNQPAADQSVEVGQESDQPTTETPVDEADATGTHTPVFEPGSVFERVARGELKAEKPAVVVDGLSSDDAKTTQDFSVQFEMARHPELMVFLAMNPYLYDDLYAWLAARGERDIDEALAHNKGYQEYRDAVGK